MSNPFDFKFNYGKKMKSDVLRKTITEHGGGKAIFNKKAQGIENIVKECVPNVKLELEKIYPKYTFLHESKISKLQIAEEIGIKNYKPSCETSSIKPDGGILYVVIGKNKYAILISEAKKQGSNDDRKEEGKKKQARGNAIERCFKNFNELELFCTNLSYFPFVMFIFGCDFEAGSSILDRLDGLTKYKPRNKIYVKDKAKIASVFVQENIFSTEEVYDIMIKISIISIKEAEKVERIIKYGK
jgi:type II restriction enzyme